MIMIHNPIKYPLSAYAKSYINHRSSILILTHDLSPLLCKYSHLIPCTASSARPGCSPGTSKSAMQSTTPFNEVRKLSCSSYALWLLLGQYTLSRVTLQGVFGLFFSVSQ